MLNKLLSIFLLGLFISCVSGNEKIMYIRIDRVDGLSEGSILETKGLKIGKVRRLQLNNDKVLVTAAIDPRYNIPLKSTFKLAGESLLNANACIEVELSKSDRFYNTGDTVDALPYGSSQYFNPHSITDKNDSGSIKSMKKIIQGVNELLNKDSSQ